MLTETHFKKSEWICIEGLVMPQIVIYQAMGRISDGSGTKNPGTGRIRVVLFRVPGRPGTRMNRTGRIRVK